jgi:ATP-binding cassette, subfamily B (MDR/TAP), member 1
MIYVMGGGKILEGGNHEKLSNIDGVYANLIKAQKLKESEERKLTSTSDLIPDDSSRVPNLHYGVLRSEVAISQITDDLKSLAGGGSTEKVNPDVSSSSSPSKKSNGAFFSITGAEATHSLPYLVRRLGHLNREALPLYVIGFLAAICTGAEFPAFGLIFGYAVAIYQNSGEDPASRHALRTGGDRNALWFFIISITAALLYAIQFYSFSKTATLLANKLRYLGFQSILRQDSKYFTPVLSSNID